MNDPVDTTLPSYEVHHDEAEQAMRELARAIKQTMPQGFGFTLFLFRYGSAPGKDRGELFYLSSANREDMMKMLKEFITRQEKAKERGN